MSFHDTPEGKVIDGLIVQNPGGKARDEHDISAAKHGRLRNVGFKIGHYLQTPPMFFTRDGHTVPLVDRFRGRPAFMIAGGPSFASVDKSLLTKPGVLSMGYNNVVKLFRTNMWCEIDDPSHFLQSVWMDPRIEKFIPYDHAEKYILDSSTHETLNIRVGDCPNVWFFRRNEYFDADRFLFEDTFNWGNHGDFGGARSGTLAAIRILYLLGIRTIYLLGFDYHMDENTKYCFDQDRTPDSIANNNNTFREMIKRFTELKPIFGRYGLEVFNCNPDSHLKVFPFKKYEDAIAHCTSYLPDIDAEPTAGLYDRTAQKKSHNPDPKKRKREAMAAQRREADEAHGKPAEKPLVIDPALTLDKARINKKEATKALNLAKEQLEKLEAETSPTDATLEMISIKKDEIKELRHAREQAIEIYNILDEKDKAAK